MENRPDALPAHTLAAYLAAVYRISGEPHIDMKIGEINREVASLMQRHHVNSALFVTAFNPFGAHFASDINDARQKQLAARIDSMNLHALPGVGFDPNEAQPHSEASLLVLGGPPTLADALLREFEQNAVVIVDMQGLPQLLLHPKFR